MAFHSRPRLGAKCYYFWPLRIPTPRWWDLAAPAHPLYPIIEWAGRHGFTRSHTHHCDRD